MSRRFQFSLKAMMVLVLAISCFLGGMALQARIEATRRTDSEKFFMDAMQRALERGADKRQFGGDDSLRGMNGSAINDLRGN